MNPGRILIVDDEENNRDLLGRRLAKLNYNILYAENGIEAIEQVKLNPDLDLVILDIMMPQMDGTTALKLIRKDMNRDQLPIIMATAKSDNKDIVNCFELGANDYITKPVEFPILNSRISFQISRKKIFEEIKNLNISLEKVVDERTESLKKTHHLLESIIQSTSNGIFSCERDGTITFINTRFCDIVPYSGSMIGASLFEVLKLKETNLQAKFRTVIDTSEAFISTEERLESTIDIMVSLSLSPRIVNDDTVGVVGVIEDVTKQKLLEIQLMQASKMVMLGEMASGVAHELNQPLNVISIAAQMILNKSESDTVSMAFLKERSEKILNMVDRSTKIINQLRSLSRKTDLTLKKTDALFPIVDALDIVSERLRLNNIAVSLTNTDSLPPILADENSLSQVFINLIINAIDALLGFESDKEKKISIDVKLNPEKNAIIYLVSDNGPGIPDYIHDRVFEPFFTTKEVGKGTGLGLSISYTIIQNHKGKFQLQSDKNGTSFEIHIPAVQSNITEITFNEQEIKKAKSESIFKLSDRLNQTKK